eukprot:gene8548-7803_t
MHLVLALCGWRTTAVSVPGAIPPKKEGLRRDDTQSGNRTRVTRVAGGYSTTGPTASLRIRQ